MPFIGKRLNYLVSVARNKRTSKSQKGQFFTPPETVAKITEDLYFHTTDKILEPSCGNGNFLITIIEKMLPAKSLNDILKDNIWAVELDPLYHEECLFNIKERFGSLPKHNIIQGDFFKTNLPNDFNFIIGNPPFGGTISDKTLDKKYGRRNEIKIKKETYSFFLVKCIEEHLINDGRLVFICSDSFLTIPTMKGLRVHLMKLGTPLVKKLPYFSDETNYPMVVLDYVTNPTGAAVVYNKLVLEPWMQKTGNYSYMADEGILDLFRNVLGQFIQTSSGLTTGCNKLFIREVKNGKIIENYDFVYNSGVLKIIEKEPIEITLPHPDYAYYNKANQQKVYSEPSHVIYWKDDGRAVKTFKKQGPPYLHGVGGAKHYFKEGFTWSLVSNRLKVRYLPKGYVFDSGAPCGFLRDNVDKDELYYILAWLLSDKANNILKTYINHTKNIQSHDVSRLPYPVWAISEKQRVIDIVKELINDKTKIELLTELNAIFK